MNSVSQFSSKSATKRGRSRLKVFVGKGAILRDTAALASGKLPSTDEEKLVFSYVFSHDTFLSGEITFNLWVSADAHDMVSYAVRLDRTRNPQHAAQLEGRFQLPCLSTVESPSVPVDSKSSAEVVHGMHSLRTQAVSLQILTAPIHFSVGEKLLISLQLRGHLAKSRFGGAVLFGGNHPSQLTLFLEKSAASAE